MNRASLVHNLLANIDENMEAADWEVVSLHLVTIRIGKDGCFYGRIYSGKAETPATPDGSVVKCEKPIYETGPHKTIAEAQEELKKAAKLNVFW